MSEIIKYIELEATKKTKWVGRVSIENTTVFLEDKVNEFLQDKKECDLIKYEIVDDKFRCFYRVNQNKEDEDKL